MLDVKFGFTVFGAIIFLLPMLINIVYFVMPAGENAEATKNEKAMTGKMRIVEMVEQVTRILYAIAICVLIFDKEIEFTSPWLFLGLAFLMLYYIVWLRYFLNGRDVKYLSKSFCFIPIPLAIFPVLYYICAAFWLHNCIAVGIMIVFGIAHNIVSRSSL